MTGRWAHHPLEAWAYASNETDQGHIHDRSPNVITDSRSTLMETLCGCYKLQPQVVPMEVNRSWTDRGYTAEIFCGDCLREMDDSGS